jgi:Domain of Unknown Function (DUF1206)
MTSLELTEKTKAGRNVSPWVKWLARMGMLCSAALWILVGALAVGVAVGAGGETTDRTGALHEIAKQSWGTVVLILLAVGFAGYAVWRFAVAIVGRKVETNEELGWGKRLWHAARGVFYGFLCYATVAILLGSRSDSNEKEQTAAVLDLPGGRWIVGAIGVAVVVWGFGSAYRAITRGFKDDLHTERMSATAERWTTRAGVVGYLARAVVLILIGTFVVRAAYEYDPDEAVGLDGALQKLAHQSFGPLLLGLVAAGLVVYGLFYLVRAIYREV